MSAPNVTVLMTVYNGGRYLLASVESILRQTFRDFEFLIIDDASSDGALDAVVRFGDPRIRIHRNITNQGQTASLNLGLSLAKGQWIARMDADDIAYPHWLEKSWESLKNHPQVTVAGCRAVVMDQGGNIYKHLRQPLESNKIILKSIFSSPINHVGCLMNRQIILDQKGYDPQFRIAADYDLWSRLLRNSFDLSTFKHVGVCIRVHQNSVSVVNRGGNDRSELSKIIHANIKHFAHQDLDDHDIQLLWTYVYMPDVLSVQDFDKADHLFIKIYHQLDLNLIGGNIEQIKNFIQEQRKIIYIKALFSLVQQRRYTFVSTWMRSKAVRYGVWSFYGIAWLLSLGGLLCIVGAYCYDSTRKLQALLAVRKVVL